MRSSSKRAPWEDPRGARLQHQLGRKEEDLALFQDMRIRESSSNCSPSSLDSSSPLDHLHSSGKFRGAPLGRNDLLASEMDKSDYDWLLTPPGTPLFPSLDRDYLIPSPSNGNNNNIINSNNLRDSTSSSSSSRKLSRLSTPTQQLLVSSSSSGSSAGSASASKLYTGPTTRGSNPSPARRQSAPLPSSSTLTPSGIKQRPTPNTTTGSRSSTPTRRPSSAPSPSSTTASAAPRRASTPTRTPSRPATPTRPSPTSSFSSTTTTTTGFSSSSSTRPSTPTRRSPTVAANSASTNGRLPSSRGTSPVRRPAPDRSPSTNSSGPGPGPGSGSSAAPLHHSTTMATGAMAHHHHLTRSFNNHLERGGGGVVGGDHHHQSFSRRAVTSANDLQLPKSDRKPAAKFCGSRETSFFGTSISKKSLDTAIRHMDIRRSSPSGFKASPPPAASVTYPKSTRSQIHQQQQNNHVNHHQQNNSNNNNNHYYQVPDYSRLVSSVEDKSVNGLFEHVQDAMDDSFLLEFNSLTASSEATFLEGADYLKDP